MAKRFLKQEQRFSGSPGCVMNKRIFNIAIMIGFSFAACRQDQSREMSTPAVARAPRTSEQVLKDSATAPSELATKDSTGASLCDDYVVNGLLPAGETQAVITAKLGAPKEIQRRAIANKYAPEVADTLVSLYYAGIQFEFYRMHEGTEYLNRVLVSDNQYLKYPNLGIGAADTTILRSLGEPHSTSEDEYEYVCNGCPGPEEPVYFVFQDGYVRRVEFTHYID